MPHYQNKPLLPREDVPESRLMDEMEYFATLRGWRSPRRIGLEALNDNALWFTLRRGRELRRDQRRKIRAWMAERLREGQSRA